MGAALHEVLAKGTVRREDIFVTSKLGNARHHPDDVPVALATTLAVRGPWPQCPHRRHPQAITGICACASRSPQDLQLDYLDLYLMHWPLAFQPGPAGFGKIREGISLIDTWRAMEVRTARGQGMGAGRRVQGTGAGRGQGTGQGTGAGHGGRARGQGTGQGTGAGV